MSTPHFETLSEAITSTRSLLLTQGKTVETQRWQGLDIAGDPNLASFEYMNHSFTAPIPPTIAEMKREIRPNLPWADDHFMERVGGLPINPGEQYKNWPFYREGSDRDQSFRAQGGKFTHNYMERIWPKFAGDNNSTTPHQGIRYAYGDFNDVINLLAEDPFTRQAYLPIWFPEDTGAVHRGRVPCTIGYQFLRRGNFLHIFYPIRACDYIRHFRDDIYFACRMVDWALARLKEKSEERWGQVQPGRLTMHIWSLHIFVGDIPILHYRTDL